MRLILLLHRYLAVTVGVLMTLWCLSGFVMMYQGFPDVGTGERLAGLEPLDFDRCCDARALESFDGAASANFRIEMLLGDPVIRPAGSTGRAMGDSAINLRTGGRVATLTPVEASIVAASFANGNGIAGSPRLLGIVELDQWTIQTARRNQPAYHFSFDDSAGNEVYVSGATGEVFQATDRRERVLAWLGAIPHWLYPTMLRQNGPLWTEIVIWTSVLGCFLAATGLYVGVARLRRRRSDNRLVSPFRGWWYWHHISGLVFGVLTLTWVFSGLMTMNPWGALSGGGGGNYGSAIRGTATWSDARTFLQSATENANAFRGYRLLQSTSFDDRLYVIASNQFGSVRRFDGEARPAGGVTGADMADASESLPVRRLELSLLENEDAYYYGRKSNVELPVYRLILDDAEQTRVYVTASSGNIRVVGATNRLSRWIRTGLHGLDFAGLRVRPVWDIVVFLMLAGVTAVCATGTWLAFKRVGRDWRFARASIAARRSRSNPGEQVALEFKRRA